MIDEEMHFLFKFFAERIHYLTRIITRCQQEGMKRRHADPLCKVLLLFQVNTTKLLSIVNYMSRCLFSCAIQFPSI